MVNLLNEDNAKTRKNSPKYRRKPQQSRDLAFFFYQFDAN
jgi:hypothetical protein